MQTHHVYSTLKWRGNGCFPVVSTWNTCGVFVGHLKTLPVLICIWLFCGQLTLLELKDSESNFFSITTVEKKWSSKKTNTCKCFTSIEQKQSLAGVRQITGSEKFGKIYKETSIREYFISKLIDCFCKEPFYRTPPGDCFWVYKNHLFNLESNNIFFVNKPFHINYRALCCLYALIIHVFTINPINCFQFAKPDVLVWRKNTVKRKTQSKKHK